MLTRALLKSLATGTVFERGLRYYKNGSVGRLKRAGNVISAKVHGTYSYKVQLTLTPTGPALHCNCPYDFEGICKHAVALGLAALAEYTTAELQPTAPATPEPAAEALEETLSLTGTARQLKFLHALLRRNADLAAQFVQFVAAETAAAAGENAAASKAAAPAASPKSTEISPEAVSTEVYEALSDLVFDEELLLAPPSYHGRYDDEDDYYGEGDEDLLVKADEVIDEVLLPFAMAVADDLRTGRLLRALRRWVGVHEGIEAAQAPETDEFDLFSYDGYPAHVQERWDAELTESGVFSHLKTTVFSAAETDAALEFLFARPGVAIAEDAHHRIHPAFQELLLSLARHETNAYRLLPYLELPADLDTAHVLLQTARTLGADDIWLTTATQFADADFSVATELLEYHRRHADSTALHALLQRLWPRFGAQLVDYVLLHLTPADAPKLYLSALEMRCRNRRSIDDYRTLRQHWTPAQRQQFVNEQLTTAQLPYASDPLFAAELLAAENRDAELLALLRARDWRRLQSVGEMLALAVPRFPHECIDLVMERTETYLNAGERGRDLYQAVAGWLTTLKAVPELAPEVSLFAAHLYTEQSRLNALREELRAAQLVQVVKQGNTYRLIPPPDPEQALEQDKRPT